MITLAGVELGENLYLNGLESASLSGSTQKRLLGGGSVVFIQPQLGGRTLILGTMQDSGIMGIWCQSKIQELKVFEQQAMAVTLDYHGDIYTVLIIQMSFEPMFQNQSEGPDKSFLGELKLIEVTV